MAVACVVDPLDPSTPIRLMVAGSGLEVFKSYNSRDGRIYSPSSSRKYRHAFFIGNPSLQSSVRVEEDD